MIKRGRDKKKERQEEIKGKIEIYICVVTAGMVGYDCDSFLEHLGHG